MADNSYTSYRSRYLIHPEERASRHRRTKPRPLTVILVFLAVAACVHFIAVLHPAQPANVISDCQALIRNTDYTKLVRFQPPAQEMQAIQYIDQAVGGQPAALVPVSDTRPGHQLDVYVFGCAMQRDAGQSQGQPALTLLFKQQSVSEGSVSVTRANTLSVGQVDTTLSPAMKLLMRPAQQQVYREYSWQHGRFVQVLFPGLYPVTSRSEAEALQDQANNGYALPWGNPLFTTRQMAKDIFHWKDSNIQETLQGTSNGVAHVLLLQKQPCYSVTVTLRRLIQPGKGGLWFVTDAHTPGITLDHTALDTVNPSPLKLQGTMKTQEEQGSASTMLYSHALSPLQILNAPTIVTHANGTYTAMIMYSNVIPGQQGLLLINHQPGRKGTAGQLLFRNILLG